DYGAIYWAEQKLSAGMTATFFSTFPIFTALFSQLFNKSEPVSPKTWWGLILGLGGVVLLFHREWRIVGWETVIPAGAVVIGAMGGAFHLVIVKKFLGHMNAITLTTHQMVWGSLMLLTIGTLKGEWSHVHTSPASLAAIGYLALVATALAFTLYYLMLQHCSAVTASLLVYCIPPVTLFLDWLVFQERVGLQTALAICIIFMGIGLSQQSQIRKKDLKKMVER
ncbi:MAG: DMT family transporter, partial [Acidobacteria bacterium]|nr:DMT family transporter [Acidobacteriota bacterium]